MAGGACEVVAVSYKSLISLRFNVSAPSVPGPIAAAVLLSTPQGELFLTNSGVEVYRLVRARWKDLSPESRERLEQRIADGPPTDWFKADSDIERIVDRSRFDVLEHLLRDGITLSLSSQELLKGIRERHPEWAPRPQEQAGFHIWHEGSSSRITGDAGKLDDVADEELVAKAKKANDNKDFLEGDAWQALCQTDVPRALRGLQKEAEAGHWPGWAWRPFIWAASKIEPTESIQLIAQLLLHAPAESFAESLDGAAWWLDEKAKALDDRLLWALWDRIEAVAPREHDASQMKDAYGASINAPPGHLATVLLKKLEKGVTNAEIPEELRLRFDRLASAGGTFGRLARVRFAADVSFLFYRAPAWTTQHIVPLFDWSSPEAPDAWSARKYANHIGDPELVGLTKKPFLELFRRSEVSDEDLRVFADWLAAIAIANRARDANYPISTVEMRSALRHAADGSLPSVGHRLAMEMERAKPEEKVKHWHEVVGPVFQSIWPLDVELQSPSTNFKLVQILRATGDAFPEAADVIIPFLRAEDPRQHTSVYSISGAGDILYTSAPDKMLDLLAAVVGEAPVRGPYGLGKALDRLRHAAPSLVSKKKFQKLASVASLQ